MPIGNRLEKYRAIGSESYPPVMTRAGPLRLAEEGGNGLRLSQDTHKINSQSDFGAPSNPSS